MEHKSGRIRSLKYWELIADNLRKAGWTCGCISAVTSDGRIIWIADAHRDAAKRYVVHADKILTAFVELETIIHETDQRRCQIGQD